MLSWTAAHMIGGTYPTHLALMQTLPGSRQVTGELGLSKSQGGRHLLMSKASVAELVLGLGLCRGKAR